MAGAVARRPAAALARRGALTGTRDTGHGGTVNRSQSLHVGGSGWYFLTHSCRSVPFEKGTISSRVPCMICTGLLHEPIRPILCQLNRLEHLARGRRGFFSSRPTRSKGGQARVVDVDVPRHDRQVAVCGPDGRLLGVAARRTTSERAADGRLPSRLDAIKRTFSAAEGAIRRGEVSAWRGLAKSISTFICSEKRFDGDASRDIARPRTPARGRDEGWTRQLSGPTRVP